MPASRVRRVSPAVTPKPVVPEREINYRPFIIVGTLFFILGFAMGSLYTRVKSLEAGATGAKQQAGAQPAGNQPAAQQAKAELKVTDEDPALGPKNAKVTVVEFADFQCPFCGAFSGLDDKMIKNMQSRDPSWQPAISNIKKDYVQSGKVRLVWKDYPFLGAESNWAAEAGRCAMDQNKFWEWHDYMFSHQNGENQGSFSKDNLKKFAAELKLNTDTFNNCLDSGKYTAKVQQSLSEGQGVGVNGTPATFINGKLVSGAASYTQFKTMIDEELAKK